MTFSFIRDEKFRLKYRFLLFMQKPSSFLYIVCENHFFLSHGMEKIAVTNSHWSLFTLFTVLSFEQHAIHSRETSYRHFSYGVIEYTIVRHKSHDDIHSILIILRCNKSLSKEKNEWSSYFCIIRFCTIFARVYREFFRLSDRISSSPSSCLIDYFLM